MTHPGRPPRAFLSAAIVVGGVLLVAVLSVALRGLNDGPGAAALASPIPIAESRWAAQGTRDTTDFQIPVAGTYALVWSMNVGQVQPSDPLSAFRVDLSSVPGVQGAEPPTPTPALTTSPNRMGLVNFQQPAGQPGPFGASVSLGPTTDGIYVFHIETCQYCAWQLSLWPN